MQGYIQLIKSPEGAGRADCFCCFFPFSAKVWSCRRHGGWDGTTRWEGGFSERAAEVEADDEKQQMKAQLLSPRALKSSQESTQKIVTVLSQNYVLSGKDM